MATHARVRTARLQPLTTACLAAAALGASVSPAEGGLATLIIIGLLLTAYGQHVEGTRGAGLLISYKGCGWPWGDGKAGAGGLPKLITTPPQAADEFESAPPPPAEVSGVCEDGIDLRPDGAPAGALGAEGQGAARAPAKAGLPASGWPGGVGVGCGG